MRVCIYGSECKLIQVISCILIEIRLRFATNLVAFDCNVFVRVRYIIRSINGINHTT